jgi:hypothetical protein
LPLPSWTQWPLWHWVSLVQRPPTSWLLGVTQAPFLHTKPETHCESKSQLVGQAPMLPVQTKLFGQGGRPGRPLVAGPQTPSTPDSVVALLHPSQAPVQARLQQTPSTQKPLWH